MSVEGPPFIVDGHVVVAPAPEGWIVDLDNPTRDEATITAIWWTLGFGNAIALFFLGQNIFVKWFVQRQLHIETILLIISWAMGVFVMAWLCDTIRLQTTGSHMWEVKMVNFNRFMVMYYVTSTVYTAQIGVVKVALALFYRRISPARWWQITINSLIAFMTLFTIVIVFISIFACNPVAKSWDLTILTGSCLNRNAIYLTITSTHVLLDLILISLPIPVVLGLQMGRRQKIGLIFIFVIGGSTVVSSALRLSVLVPLLEDPDQTWGMTKAILWIVIECNLLVMCASLPTLSRFTSHVAPKLIGNSFVGSSARPTGQKSGATAESQGFRTFGKGSDRRRLDTFGMTVDDEGKDEDVYGKPLELNKLGGGEPVEVTVVAGTGKDRTSLRAPSNSKDHHIKHNDKSRDAASTNSLDNGNEGNNNSTWDPLAHSGDEHAIIQTRTYTVQRDGGRS